MSRILCHITRFLAVQGLFIDHSTATRTLRWAKRVPQGTTEVASSLAPDSASAPLALVSTDSVFLPVFPTPGPVSLSSVTAGPVSVSSSPSITTPSVSAPSSVSTSESSAKAPENGTLLRCAAHDNYFDFDNFDESEAGPWYAEWAYNTIQTNSKGWQDRISEPNYFALQTLQWMDMDCAVSYKGCRNMPNCDEILARVNGNITLARNIYFITQSFNNLNLIVGVISEQSLATQTNCLGMASTMANTFFWKYSDEAQYKCDMVAGALKAAVSGVLMAMAFTIPAIGVMTTGAKFADEGGIGYALKAEAKGAAAEAYSAKLSAASAAEYAEADAVKAAEETAAKTADEAAAAASEAEAVSAEEVSGAWSSESEGSGLTSMGTGERDFNAAVGRAGQRMRTLEEAMAPRRGIKYTNPWTRGPVRIGQKPTVRNPMHLPDLEPKRTPVWIAHVRYNFARPWNKYTQPLMWQALSAWAITSLPAQFYPVPLTAGVCKMFPNPSKDMPQEYERQIDMLITGSMGRFRDVLEESIAVLNRGSGNGDNGDFLPEQTTSLAETLINGHYVALNPDARERFLEKPVIIEHQMTNNFKNALISGFLKGQMCHLHCTTNIPETSDGSDPCTLNGARFCPDPQTLCQAQCWQNSNKAKVMEVFGADSMMKWGNQWDITLQDFLKGSYEHWQQFRFRPTPQFPSIDDLLDNTVTDRSGSFLPVCMDHVVAPHPLDEKDNVVIPCTCGDVYGNETRIFFEDAGFYHWSELAANPTKLGHVCAADMEHARVHPVQELLTECELGSHWPVDGESEGTHGDGMDQYCEDLAQFVLLWRDTEGKSEAAINCLACFADPVGQNIMDEQQDKEYFAPHRSHYNFREGCRLFADNYVGKQPPCGLNKPQREVWDGMQKERHTWDFGKNLSADP
ncbi:hypothetical protein MMC13_006941 [Lambiella insularis]|nr:hypothetical protein [Lambiella insularis]